jgi:hypothetical protein
MDAEIGERFAQAIAAKDSAALTGLLGDDVDFKALTPGRVWEATTGREVVDDIIFGRWFEAEDNIEAVESIETDVVVDRPRVAYRFRITNPDGEFRVEQQAYFGVVDGRINWLRVMCSGFRQVAPVESASTA